MRGAIGGLALVVLWSAFAGAGAPESKPTRIEPVGKAEKARLLAAETPAQKKLRAELAEFAKQGQKIYFNANGDGVQRLYAMNCDGSEVRCLTPAPGPGGEHPHVSPDGSRITFVAPMDKKVMDTLPLAKDRHRKLEGAAGIYVMGLGAADNVPEPIAVGLAPRWSPDGKKLVYYYKRKIGRRVAIFDLEKRTEHLVLHPAVGRGIHYPVISPDGKYLFVCGKNGALLELNAAGTGPAENAKRLNRAFKMGCNIEFSRDGKRIVWVIDTARDAGGWLCWAPFEPEAKVKASKLPLGWDKNSVNYYPDFSPLGKYLVYAHADQQKGVKSWLLQGGQDLYVTRFPGCEVTVRLTWNNAANYHPQWWAPAGDQAAAAPHARNRRILKAALKYEAEEGLPLPLP